MRAASLARRVRPAPAAAAWLGEVCASPATGVHDDDEGDSGGDQQGRDGGGAGEQTAAAHDTWAIYDICRHGSTRFGGRRLVPSRTPRIAIVPASLLPRSSASRASTAPARPPRRASTRTGCEARGLEVVELREPGGTHVGERVRELVLLELDARICPRSEALLFAASRAQAVDEIIAPALARGAHVVADRFVDSSLVYQGSVRALGVDAVRAVNDFAMAGVLPDRTVVLELPAREAHQRREGLPDDRIEAEALGFQELVAEGYAALAAAEPRRIVRVLAEGDPDAIAARVREAIGGD